MFKKILTVFLIICGASISAQVSMSGKIYDEYLEPFPSALIAFGNQTVSSEFDGSFTLKGVAKFPFKIKVTALGYQSEEIDVLNEDQELNIILKENTTLDEVVISASRSPERIIESPVTIERIGVSDIRKNTSVSFYDGLTNLKGIESREASYGYKSINSRGFSTFDNTRFVQLVDGVETSIPALNFSAGNLLGLSDLDVKNVEILPGASSALYGANAFNGILLMTSKNPFDYDGISAYFKTGVTSQKEAGNNQFYDGGIRMAYRFSDYFAAKVNMVAYKAEEWHANDDRNTSGVGGVIKEGNRNDTSDYDGVNFYGDEFVITIPGIGRVSRTGYSEKELYEYDGHSVKFDGSLHYRPMGNDKLEIVFNSRFSTGNNLYQGTNRFSQEGYYLEQHKLEVLGDNFFLRGYYTGNESGRAHDLRFAGAALNETYNPSRTWFTEYATAYSGFVPGVTGGSDSQARTFADRNRLKPGTSQFKNALEGIKDRPINQGGAGVADQTGYYHVDGNYNFKNLISWAEIQVGASYREFNINSQGTLFTDKDGPIKSDLFGLYAQVQKELLDERLKFTGSLRYDEAKNFKGNYSPRIALTYDVGGSKNKIIRVSYQTGFRNPSTTEQYFGLQSGPNRFILGTSLDNLDRFSGLVNNNDGSTNTLTGQDAFKKAFILENGSPIKANVDPIKPERVTSYELGYRSIVNIGATSIVELDVNGYYNQYKDFVAFNNVLVPNYDGLAPNGKSAFENEDLTQFTLNTNTKANVDSYGVGVGITTKVFKNFNFGANYTLSRMVFDQVSDPNFQPGYNTPEHQVKFMLGNANLFKNFGFNVNVRWQNEFLWQSSFLSGAVEDRTILDAQLNYRIPSIKSRFKIGGTNLTGKEYTVAPGSGLIGSLYYFSWVIND